MNTDEIISITAEVCTPRFIFDKGGCSRSVLKIPKEEVKKLLISEPLNGVTTKNKGLDFQAYPEFFAVSFVTVLSFWAFSKGIGLILETIKRA
ncbi:hypothetical protein QJU89_03020 [Pasteurella skyensis]|uniref:Uncharacterized protein n=1 Tax=Phocoenobacter skyensis TaxID=97481 RepID=A0AAJ6NBM6_9PAST|nr:hypothetical protein [Pasteurella skyensis]MDP8163495.1 hypothetical protein [Pasteurella skyensis]MDP8173810.1 hypothetical protein [Pasteurella skyensis]MDP8179959.1 hypothetical protein [Pasteurella skyensis]MDP8182656.1 hypothetical protein [Pasteurella skyensis]MDP8182669.1 hypothetical protein [Pasteurella skyensis]